MLRRNYTQGEGSDVCLAGIVTLRRFGRCHAGWVSDNPYRGHRFPREIISECVWHYFRFGVSFRVVEDMMATRGVIVTYETIRRWCDKFGKQYADGLRRRRARTGDKWHLDEVFLKINGVTHYLWRAVDQNGVVLDILVQPRRDRFCRYPFLSQAVAGDWARTPGHYY